MMSRGNRKKLKNKIAFNRKRFGSSLTTLFRPTVPENKRRNDRKVTNSLARETKQLLWKNRSWRADACCAVACYTMLSRAAVYTPGVFPKIPTNMRGDSSVVVLYSQVSAVLYTVYSGHLFLRTQHKTTKAVNNTAREYKCVEAALWVRRRVYCTIFDVLCVTREYNI